MFANRTELRKRIALAGGDETIVAALETLNPPLTAGQILHIEAAMFPAASDEDLAGKYARMIDELRASGRPDAAPLVAALEADLERVKPKEDRGQGGGGR